MAGCTSFLGTLSLENSSLANLNGLEHLRSVGGDMNFFRNPQLVDVHGLRALVTVGGGLIVSSEPTLETLDGLEAIRSVGRLSICNNQRLRTIGALSGLDSVTGDLTICSNRMLTQAEAEAFAAQARVGGMSTVTDNKL